MTDAILPPEGVLDGRLYRWLPEMESIQSGLAETLRTLQAEGSADDQQAAARSALAHLDYAIRALQWLGWYEIPIEALGQGPL
jgi:hypothetical protein